MRDKGLGITLTLGIIGFVLMYAITNGFASPDQNLVASSDVTVRASAPTVNDDLDFNFQAGYIWIDAVGGAVYIAESVADGAAVWTDITAGGSTFNGEEGGSLVVSNVSVINFGPGFDLTDNGSGELAVVLDYTEDAVSLSGSEVTGTLDISDHTNLVASTGITLTGDTLTVDLGVSIDTSEITDGTILEADLAAVDTPNDEECLTYETTTGDFEWQACASGGSGTLTTIKEGDSQIGGADIVTLDFGAGFDCAESPDTEINCTLDYAEDPVALGGSDVTGTLSAGNGGTGQTSATNDAVLIGNGTGFTLRTLSDCVAAGNAVTYNASTDAWGCATGYLTVVATGNITDGTILESDLAAVDTPGDEECLTFESTGGDFEWQTCSPGGGGGTVTTVKQDGSQVGDADIVTLDFGDGLTCTESPDTEINCSVDLGELITLTTEVDGTLPVANGGTGQTAATEDGVLVGNGTVYTNVVLTSCSTSSSAVTYNTTTNSFSCNTGFLTTVDISDNTNLTCGTGCTLTDDEISVDDDYLLNTGDVGTGVYDFGGADSVELPNGAGGTTVNATGEVTIDTTSESLNFFDGTEEKVLQPVRSFSISFEDPTSSEDLSIWRTSNAITIISESCTVIGTTPSVTVTLRHGTDRSGTGAELNTGGNAITSTTTGDPDVTFDDATIVAGSAIWLETTAQTGTVTSLSCTWEYTIDP